MKTQGAVATLALLTSLGVGSGQAWAVDEVIVTAQRKEEKLQDVPLAVTAIQAGQIDKRQINVLKDIGENVPNLQTYTVTAGAEALQVHARGASVQNPGFNTSESPVSFYEDDVYRGRLASINLDLADVERIEVLRGPQGTLYGRNTLAGAVKIVTRTPGDDRWIDASLGYGNYDTTRVSLSAGGPLEQGALAGSVAGLYARRSNGWQSNPITQQNPGQYENRALRGKLHWYGTENLDVTVTVWGVKAENDGYNGVPYTPFSNPPLSTSDKAPIPSNPVGDFYANYSPAGANFGDTSQQGATLTWSYKVNDFTVQSITGFAKIDDKFGFDLGGGAIDADFDTLADPGMPGLLIRSDSSLHQWSQQLQLLGKSFGEKLNWIFGLNYLNESGKQQFGGVQALVADFLENSATNTDTYALFGEGLWHLTERLSVTAGLRWTSDDKTYTNVCTGTTCSGGPVDLDKSFNELTPKASLNYKLTDAQLLYLQYGRGFQAGGFQTLCFGDLTSGPGGCGGNSYKPETVDSVEAGYKGDLFSGTLRLNAAAFYAMYSDLQDTIVGINSFPTANVGDVDVYGLEIEATWTPIESLNVFATLGAMDNSFGKRDPTAGCQNSAAGCTEIARDLPSLPKFSGKVGFDRRLPVSDLVEFFYGADLYYTDSYYSESRNLLQIDSYMRLNGFLGIGEPGGRWQVALTAKNITNRENNVSGLFANQFANIRSPLPPPEYMLTARIRL